MNVNALKKNQRGQILFLSVIITGIVLAGGLIISQIILREVRISRNIDNAFIASYAADTSIEMALYEIRTQGTDPATLTGNGTLPNGATWQREVVDLSQQLNIDFLEDGEEFVLDLFDPATTIPSGGGGVPAGYESLLIEWIVGSNIDVRVRGWDGTAFVSDSTTNCSSPCIINSLEAANAYEITLSPSNGTASELLVSAFAADGGAGSQLDMTIPITIYAEGSFGNSLRAQEVTLRRSTPW